MNVILEAFLKILLPLLISALCGFVIELIQKKASEIKIRTTNEKTKEYLDTIVETVSCCVQATNQTYVEALKKDNAFTKEAQKEAFTRTYNSIMTILGQRYKDWMQESCGDTVDFITNLIEAQVSMRK